MPEHTIPGTLIEQIRSGRAVLVVGAGIGVPSWKQVLERMNDELRERGGPGDEAAAKDLARILHKGDLVRAVGFLARTLGGYVCDRIVSDAWKTPDELPEIVEAISRLPFRLVWTTFPGELIEEGVKRGSPPEWPTPAVLTYKEAADIRPRRRTLLKILGNLKSYVVTPSSVRTALHGARDLREHASSYYSDGALVFVGFRFGDPDLAALLDRLFGVFEPPKSNHYMVASGVGPVTVDELMAEHHIEVINLAGKGADETATAALLEYLEQLRASCEEAGITLSQAEPEPDDLYGWLEVLASDPGNATAKEAIAAIEQAANDSGDTERLIEAIMGRVEHEDTAPERAALLRQLASVFETQVGDLPKAFTALTAALREAPADTTAVDEAERLAEATDGWTELVTDVAHIAPEIEDELVAAGYWARLGRWYFQHLDRADYAIAAFKQAQKLDASNTAAHTGLEELYRKAQRWAELADVLTAHLEIEPQVDRQVELHLALGDLYENQLASTARAITSYQAAADLGLDLAGGNDEALVALQRLYKRDERWGKLAQVLEQRADGFEAAGDTQRASATRRELATLRADKLGDLEGAIGKYEAALNADESDIQALRALEELYEKVGRSDDYLRTLSRLVEVVPESERPAILRRLATEYEEREGARASAAECYERVLDFEPAAEDAYRALERLHRDGSEWYELVSALERHIAATKAPAPRVALYLELAEVFEGELDDPHRAIEAYLNALAINEEHRESLRALARLYQRTESWDRAADILVKHAQLEGERGAAQWHEAGQVVLEKMEDAEIAERHFEKALEIDATYLPALAALADLHEARGSWANALTFLERAEQASSNRLERVQISIRAADIAEEKLEDHGRALGFLLAALRLDPEHVEAGTRAVEWMIAEERWGDAIPILEMLARKTDPEDKLEKARREAELGRACAAVGLSEKAAKHYRHAVDADPDNMEAALGLAAMLYTEAEAGSDAEPWKEVDKRYREILARHRTGLADGQIVEIWHRLGVAARRFGDDKKADNAFRRALERDPGHASSLAALIEVATARKDWKTVVEAKRDQLDAGTEEEKLRLLEEIGAIYREELDDPVSALGAYLEAVQMRPESHVLLHKTLEIYTEQKQWRRAIETLATLASHEADPTRKSKYHYAAAVIGRDELDDVELAVEHFNQALDNVPSTPKAFDAIDRLLTKAEDWKNLARAYRRMLKRVGEDASPEQLLALWTRLGDICLDHLEDVEAAIAAFEVATSLDSSNLERHEQLADLYLEAGEPRRHDAIEELQVLVQAYPDRVELYRGLSNLYQAEHDVDKSFCLAQALCFLGAANDTERSVYELHRPRQFALANRRLTEELWQKAVIHPRENRHVNAIFSSLVGSIAATTAQPPGAFNLGEESRTDLARDPSLVARVFKYSTNILALDPEPHLYLQPQSVDGIRVANTSEKGRLVPSVLVGAPHVDKKDERELAFEVGKRLAYFRPERYVNYALQTLPKLEAAYLAALSASGARAAARLGELGGEAGKMVAHLRKTVPAAVLEQVGAVADKLGEEPNGVIVGWRTATDLTANRAGLILCNDLETAARIVATEPAGMSTMSAKDRLRDLLAYSVSESYFAVRRHLGVRVQEGT